MVQSALVNCKECWSLEATLYPTMTLPKLLTNLTKTKMDKSAILSSERKLYQRAHQEEDEGISGLKPLR
jgi:hypothetical protein